MVVIISQNKHGRAQHTQKDQERTEVISEHCDRLKYCNVYDFRLLSFRTLRLLPFYRLIFPPAFPRPIRHKTLPIFLAGRSKCFAYTGSAPRVSYCVVETGDSSSRLDRDTYFSYTLDICCCSGSTYRQQQMSREQQQST